MSEFLGNCIIFVLLLALWVSPLIGFWWLMEPSTFWQRMIMVIVTGVVAVIWGGFIGWVVEEIT